MDILIKGIRILLLLFSGYGYLQHMSKRIRVEFALGALLTGIGSAMFFAGILNILPEMAWALTLLGCGLAVYSLLKRDSIRNVWTVGIGFFVGCSLLLLILLYGSRFTRYDDFSHWATVVKLMLEKNRFPNFSDTGIMFQSYPLGSAAFLYYFAKVTGIKAEWAQMYAQAVLMVGVLIGMIALFKRLWGKIAGMAVIICLLCSNGPFTSLLVDTLLPAVALGGVAYCFFYRDCLTEKIGGLIPYMVYLMTIKNSGIFFVLILLGYTLYRLLRGQKKWLFRWSIAAVCPFLTLLLWQKHVKLVFADGMQAKHSMSLRHFKTILGDKTSEQIYSICTGFAGQMFSWRNGVLWLLGFSILLCALLHFAASNRKSKIFGEAVVLSAISYLAYQIGMVGMYLFTMPTKEAVVLASYDRYHQTILIFLCGILFAAAAEELESASKTAAGRSVYAAVLVCCLTAIGFALKPQFSVYLRQQLVGSERAVFDTVIADESVPTGKRYLIVVDSKEANVSYLRFMGKYLLSSEAVTVRQLKKVKEQGINELRSEYDYIIVWDETESLYAQVDKWFKDDAKRRVYALF